MNDVLNGNEAASLLRSNYYNVMKKAKFGEIPSFRFGGKVLFRRSTLEKWMQEQEQRSINLGEA